MPSATTLKHHSPKLCNAEVQLVMRCCLQAGFGSSANVSVPSSVTAGCLYPILNALLMALL